MRGPFIRFIPRGASAVTALALAAGLLGEIAAYLGERRQALLAAAPSHAGPRVDLDGEVTASLESLGYVAAGAAASGHR